MSGQWTRVGAMDAVKPLVLNAETMMNVLPLLLMASDNCPDTHTRTTVDSTGCQPLAMERILLLIHASATIYYCTCHFRTILFKLSSGVRGNPRPGKILPQRTVHPKFDCSQPFYSQFCCSWRFVCTQNKATTRQPGICVVGPVAWTVYHWTFVPHLH